ncbi:MAG: hypothetical protein N4A35_15215 [Flavobacteriales bacterium]|nr:hypothetical protein [Flavobacteriales bacterium]
MNNETVFTNNERGKLLQKAWINEFILQIAKVIDEEEEKIDFILVSPDGAKNARVGLYNLKQFHQSKGMSKNDKKPIIDWVKSHNVPGFLSVIFVNNHGRVSFYDVPLDLMKGFGSQILVA